MVSAAHATLSAAILNQTCTVHYIQLRCADRDRVCVGTSPPLPPEVVIGTLSVSVVPAGGGEREERGGGIDY